MGSRVGSRAVELAVGIGVGSRVGNRAVEQAVGLAVGHWDLIV